MVGRPCQQPELQQQDLPLPAQRPPEHAPGRQRCDRALNVAGHERELWAHALAQRQPHADESAVCDAVF